MMRKAITDYQMIQPGDRILAGISGGKDSVVLFTGLARLKQFMDIPFEVVGCTLDPGFQNQRSDYSPIAELAQSFGAEYHVKNTNIGEIVFDVRQETNPCSLCARMRRGALHDMAKELGCNKVALGHHADDAVETFMMNLFQEGRIGCFSPVTYLSRKDLTVIRPLIYALEKDVEHCVRVNGLPVVKSRCPADKHTTRQWTKEFLAQMEQQMPGLRKRLMGAVRRGEVSGWKP